MMKHENPVLPQDDPAGLLAQMVAHTRYEEIPTDVIDLAKRAILDTLAVTVAGSGWEIASAIADQVAQWGGAPQGGSWCMAMRSQRPWRHSQME